MLFRLTVQTCQELLKERSLCQYRSAPAFVKVDEKGTEAGAATGIGMMPTSIVVPQQVFRVHHPFSCL